MRLRPAAVSAFVCVVGGVWASSLNAQVPAHPELHGRVVIGDAEAERGVVVLHRLSDDAQGAVDSVAVDREGRFSFALPSVPDGERNELYFASIEHDGVLYFGSALARAIQLDSLYLIQAYDTVGAPAGGADLPIQNRSVFLEGGEGDAWVVTDLLQVRNEGDRTWVASSEGVTWRYPLLRGGRDFSVMQGDVAADVVGFEDGAVVVRAPIPPGARLFVVRYFVDDPFAVLPLPGVTDVLEILVREPAPGMAFASLEDQGRLEMEPGSTFRRWAAEDIRDTEIAPVPVKEEGPPPVRRFAVLVMLGLGAMGAWLARGAGGGATGPSRQETPSRQRLVHEIAVLDEEFHARASPTDDETQRYRESRARLLDGLRG
ncbi:MAG: hypothetical protein OEZ65_11270 [Gemmatimonadota bacterium]|nr:hypothetical protein [Gemmatimonadota bacterium]MDH5760159.1 hypothetical protein [Gemmatimonadota bacterium]